MVDPLVENLFDLNNAVWKTYWYEHLLKKWRSMVIGSMLGWNRIFLMLNWIDTQISSKYILERPDLLNRQVNRDPAVNGISRIIKN